MARILVVDDELSLRQMLTIFLRKEDHDVETANNGLEALERLQREPFDLVLTDVRMPRMGGLDLLDVIRERDIPVQVIVMTAYSTTETALDAMRKGAYDYVIKPMKLAELRVLLEKCLEKSALVAENRQLKKRLADTGKRRVSLTYLSKKMADIDALVTRVAPTPSSVLILGESGTGKEVIARMLHHRSTRSERPFVAINCGAIHEQLMESELFGHAKGAFTGATKDKKGLFEAAGGGSIFLDEIGELSISLQVKLLRVLQERVVTPVGTTSEVPIDVRVIAATHNDLRDAVHEQRFRADLFYRLNVIEMRLPPLRERRDDIRPLADHFLQVMNRRLGRNLKGFEPDAVEILLALPYYGNVRELENVIERAVALEPGDVVTSAYLPDPGSSMLRDEPPGITSDGSVTRPEALVANFIAGIDRCLGDEETSVDLERLLGDMEQGILRATLQRARNNKTEAAQRLGMSFRSFRYKLAKYEADA